MVGKVTQSDHLDVGSDKRRRRMKLGRSIPISPDKNRCQSSIRFCEALTARILKKVDEFGLTPTEIQDRYPTFRKGYLAEMRAGTLFGEKRLMSICEAIGIFPYPAYAETERQQIAMLEAA
jgi:hypothetical protein